MTKRNFYKTVFRIEVLSEDLLNSDMDLDAISYAITEGDCSGVVEHESTVTLNGLGAAKALQKQGSDPGFFRLSDEGEDANEDGEVETNEE